MRLERPVAYYPQLSRALGDINAAVYFQQIYYWRDKGTREDGFIYKTKDEIEQETGLGRHAQDRIRKHLVNLGVLETALKKANGSPTLHYRINVENAQKIIESTYHEPYHSNSTDRSILLTKTTTKNNSNTKVLELPAAELKEKRDGLPSQGVAKSPAALKLFYDVIKKYNLPVTNHNHLKKWAKSLDDPGGEAYLQTLIDQDLRQTGTKDFRPTLNTPLDVINKKLMIERFYSQHQKKFA